MGYTARLLLVCAVAPYATYRSSPEWTYEVLAASVLLFLAHVVCAVWVYPFYVSPLRHLPEPQIPNRFPWYHASAIRAASNGVPYREWINSTPNEGLIRLRVLFNREHLLVTSPEALRDVLVTKSYLFSKPPQPTFLFRMFLGNGVLVADGDVHKVQRKGLAPAFAFRHIKNLYPVFWSKAVQSTRAIAAAQKASPLPNAPQSAYMWANRTTLDIIGVAGMGNDFNSLETPDNEISSTYHKIFEQEGPLFAFTSFGITIPAIDFMMRIPTPRTTTIRRGVAYMRNVAHGLINKKRAALLRAGTLDKGTGADVDILSVALASGLFTDDELADQVMTFLAAGHETTASALTWAIYLLCQHPDMQRRLRDEIRAGIPSPRAEKTPTVDAAQLDSLPYLNAVCNESMRLMPSVPMTMRDALEDTEVAGQPIPKGTRLVISAWAVNASTDLWGGDALDFKPERWLAPGGDNTAAAPEKAAAATATTAASGGAKSNFANLTFIHGPRSCIGRDFARAELLCLVAAWIGRFEVAFEGNKRPEPEIVGWVTTKPEHGLPVVFREVEGW